jgi:peroxiredoxin
LRREERSMPLAVGDRAPDFRLRGADNAYWLLGEPDKRRSVLIVFVRRESSTCRLMLPFIERLHRRGRAHEAEIFGVSLDNHADTLEFTEDYTITFPVLIDAPGFETTRAYGVRAVPTLFRLDSKLRVAEVVVGWSKESFEPLARAYLNDVGARVRTLWEPADIAPESAAAVEIADPGPR